jgi:putative hydrolase of the HAD superfamily
MESRNGLLAALFDLGDVIMQETTELKDEDQATISADLVPGIDHVLHGLRERGTKIALVSDTHRRNAPNVLGQHGLYDLFDAFAISQEIGVEKPDARIFRNALDKLQITVGDYRRVAMVGNNLERDIAGANALGLVSIWFHWNDRYPIFPKNDLETPRYTVTNSEELLGLLTSIQA